MSQDEQREQARRRRSLAKTDPEALLQEDAETLRLVGPMNKITFAERVGCSERIAHLRLSRLVEAGYADRWKERGASAHTYTAVIPAGAKLVSRKGYAARQRDKDKAEGDA